MKDVHPTPPGQRGAEPAILQSTKRGPVPIGDRPVYSVSSVAVFCHMLALTGHCPAALPSVTNTIR